MRTTLAALLLIMASAASTADAGDLPAVKTSPSNKVLVCASPGRLTAFLKSRNDKLANRFDDIATHYMTHGQDLGLRWDYAFFQMLLETGNLKFGGDVKPAQNNFAGLGATGNGEHGESFRDVSTGVRAHLEHLAMYAGERIENPVAERTRKVQEWGVLTEWQKTIKGPMTFGQLARKWAPPARKYAQEIEQVYQTFLDGPCKEADPHPELMATVPPAKEPLASAARDGVLRSISDVAVSVDGPTAEKRGGAALAKRVVEEARAEGTASRSSLGAGAAKLRADAPADTTARPETEAIPPTLPFKLLNGPSPELDPEVTRTSNQPPTQTATQPLVSKIAAGPAARNVKPTITPPAGCKVLTASYGGAKSVIIKSVTTDATHYTVLDVNEGSQARESEAYISAYAPGGKLVAEFQTQALALDKAFELCPE